MTIKKLLKKLARPVDLITIDNEGEFNITISGFDTDLLSESNLSLAVRSWEVRVDIVQKSLCEIDIVYRLVIEV